MVTGRNSYYIRRATAGVLDSHISRGTRTRRRNEGSHRMTVRDAASSFVFILLATLSVRCINGFTTQARRLPYPRHASFLRLQEQRKGAESADTAGPTVSGNVVPDALVLALVPVIWGSYGPVVKGLYAAPDVVAPPPLVFNLLSYVVSFAALTAARQLLGPQPSTTTTGSSSGSGSSITSTASTTSTTSTASTTSTTSTTGTSGGGGGSSIAEWRGGVELGLWLFMGSTVQITGIQQTTAINAAILVQTTTILVPLLDTLLVTRGPISPKLWISSAAALVGVITVSAGSSISTSTSGTATAAADSAGACGDPWCAAEGLGAWLAEPHVSNGDLLILLSAVFYSMHVIRLGRFAAQSEPVRLAQIKSLTELGASAAAIAALVVASPSGADAVGRYLSTTLAAPAASGQLYVALAVVWNGFFSTALTTWAQSVGQRTVPPTAANLLYSSQPIWAAFFASTFLGEALGPQTVVGSCILLGAILYSLYEPQKKSSAADAA